MKEWSSGDEEEAWNKMGLEKRAEKHVSRKDERLQKRLSLIKAAEEAGLGFSSKLIRTAVDKLVKVYGSIDDACTWIPQDNFTILADYILELQRLMSQDPAPALNVKGSSIGITGGNNFLDSSIKQCCDRKTHKTVIMGEKKEDAFLGSSASCLNTVVDTTGKLSQKLPEKVSFDLHSFPKLENVGSQNEKKASKPMGSVEKGLSMVSYDLVSKQPLPQGKASKHHLENLHVAGQSGGLAEISRHNRAKSLTQKNPMRSLPAVVGGECDSYRSHKEICGGTMNADVSQAVGNVSEQIEPPDSNLKVENGHNVIRKKGWEAASNSSVYGSQGKGQIVGQLNIQPGISRKGEHSGYLQGIPQQDVYFEMYPEILHAVDQSSHLQAVPSHMPEISKPGKINTFRHRKSIPSLPGEVGEQNSHRLNKKMIGATLNSNVSNSVGSVSEQIQHPYTNAEAENQHSASRKRSRELSLTSPVNGPQESIECAGQCNTELVIPRKGNHSGYLEGKLQQEVQFRTANSSCFPKLVPQGYKSVPQKLTGRHLHKGYSVVDSSNSGDGCLETENFVDSFGRRNSRRGLHGRARIAAVEGIEYSSDEGTEKEGVNIPEQEIKQDKLADQVSRKKKEGVTCTLNHTELLLKKSECSDRTLGSPTVPELDFSVALHPHTSETALVNIKSENLKKEFIMSDCGRLFLERVESMLRARDSDEALHFISAWRSGEVLSGFAMKEPPKNNVRRKKGESSIPVHAAFSVKDIEGCGSHKDKQVQVPQVYCKKNGFVVSYDISRGLERHPISCVNEYNTDVLPEDFLYITSSVIAADAHINTSFNRIGDLHCSCSGDCLRSSTPCKCTDSTRGEYAYHENGLLIKRLAMSFHSCYATENGDFITECCSKCQCNMNCGNRIVQRGITKALQVFMTPNGKGWGVRTLESIPAHSYLFEYIGEIATNEEQFYRNKVHAANKAHTYTMNLDADFAMEKTHFREGLTDSEALVLDATNFGNISRFLNHRCNDANLFFRPVQIETRDTHYYHVAFFAARDIMELEELNWDYGIDFDDDTHEVQAFQCHCNSQFCRDKKGNHSGYIHV